MANSLLVGISGLRSHQEMLQVIGNNLANVDTTAFKSSRVLFSDLVYQSIKEAQSGATGIIGSVNPIQAGSGTNLAQVDRNDAQGNLEQTGRQLDLAIEGAGYFVLQTASGPVYTRAGAFGISNDGTLVDPSTGTPLQRIGDTGEPDGANPAFQVNGDDSIKIPLGARIPGLQTSQLDITGTIPRNATAQLANVVHSESRFLTGGNIATLSTLLNDLDINIVDHIPGDLIRIAGNDVDFTPISVEFAVDNTTTMADLVSAVDAAYPGADVTFSNGRIVATSTTKGISHLNIRLDYIQPPANPDGSIPPHGETEFSSIPMVDQVEGTEATSVSFASTQVFDTRGSSFTLDLNLTKQEDDSWSLTAEIDPTIGTIVDGSVTGIRFADDGTLVQFGGTSNGDSRLVLRLNDQSEDQIIDVNFGDLGSLEGLSQTGDAVSTPLGEADGYANGVFEKVSTDADGIIFGIADNGVRFPLAQLAIANFRNTNGLKGIGDNQFEETLASGPALLGSALSGGRGAIRAGQLEGSNVELTAEFTQLIIAQRGFSANARTVTVTDEVLEELTNIIR